MAAVTWTFEADFDRSGTYETDLTASVTKPGQGVVIDRGARPDGRVQVSRLKVGLLNDDGTFTANNSGSAYYGQMGPGVPVRVRASHNANPYTLWTGYVASWKREWASRQVPMVVLDCWDIAHYLIESEPINVTVSEARDTDAALIAVMDELGLGAGDRLFDDGVQDLPVHFALDQSGMEAMMAVVRSEMGGWLYVLADGRLRFEARDSRLGVAVLDDTWGDGTDVVPHRIEELTDDQDYVTSARVRAALYTQGQADTVLFEFAARNKAQPTANSLQLAAGEIWEREYTQGQPVIAWTAMVSGTDYTANASADGTGADRVANLEVTFTDLGGGRFRLKLRNTHASLALFVTKLQIRGTQVAFYLERPESVATKTVAQLPAGKQVTVEIPFAGDAVYMPIEWASTLLRTYRYTSPRLGLTFHAGSPSASVDTARKDALLALELGQLVRYTDTGITTKGSYSDDWYYVTALKQHIPPDWGGADFITEVVLEPSYNFRNLDAIAIDDFTRANASGDLAKTTNGLTWADDGQFDINTNTARPNNVAEQAPSVALGSADQVIEVSLSDLDLDTDEECGVVYRDADTSNHWRAYVDDGSDQVILEKLVAGTPTSVATASWTPAATAEIRVIVQGNRHRVWVDQVLVIDATDAAMNTNTRAGLFARSTTVVRFDDFYAQGL